MQWESSLRWRETENWTRVVSKEKILQLRLFDLVASLHRTARRRLRSKEVWSQVPRWDLVLKQVGDKKAVACFHGHSGATKGT